MVGVILGKTESPFSHQTGIMMPPSPSCHEGQVSNVCTQLAQLALLRAHNGGRLSDWRSVRQHLSKLQVYICTSHPSNPISSYFSYRYTSKCAIKHRYKVCISK